MCYHYLEREIFLEDQVNSFKKELEKTNKVRDSWLGRSKIQVRRTKGQTVKRYYRYIIFPRTLKALKLQQIPIDALTMFNT